MNLVMALGMKQNAVLGAGRTTLQPGDTIVQVPPGKTGDFGVAHQAETMLFIPKKTKKTRTLKRDPHMICFAFLEVGFVGKIVGIRLAFDLDMSTDGSVSCQQ
jgi:hypothetical protein